MTYKIQKKLCQRSTCSHRDVPIPLSEFHRNKTQPDGLSHICKTCRKELSKAPNEIKRAHKYDKKRKKTRDKRRIFKVYKLDIEDLDRMIKEQDNRCKICFKTNKARKGVKRLFVDHCHYTGKVRGLLCSRCNIGMGYFFDSIVLLEKVIEYLKSTMNKKDFRK